jgi:predicted O-methyltransferase YrrM
MNEFTVHVKPLIADVPGWLTDEEGEALYDLARACAGKGVIVEIGSWMGKSTICLGRGSLAGASVPIYAIDPHTDHRFGDFKANVDRAGITELVTPIASLSQPAADDFHEPIELLFVDGSHEYDLVLEDFEKWVPKVVDGGWVAFHDTTWTAGPRKVVGQAVYRSSRFKDARFVVGSTTVARKVDRNSFADRARNRYVLGVKTAFWLGSSVVKKRANSCRVRRTSGARRLCARSCRLLARYDAELRFRDDDPGGVRPGHLLCTGRQSVVEPTHTVVPRARFEREDR